jgi:hypothetical protein
MVFSNIPQEDTLKKPYGQEFSVKRAVLASGDILVLDLRLFTYSTKLWSDQLTYYHFRDTLLVSPMLCLLDVYTYILLNHEEKTCDDIDSRRILVQLVDPIHLVFPIFLAHCPLLRIVLTSVSA